VGTGLSGWSGLSRFSAPSVGTILGMDAPLYQQATNGVNDQFLRKLPVYAKGKIGKLDYRLALSNPFITNNSTVPLGTLNATEATFSLKPPHLQNQGYLNYQFFDQEENTLGYMVGTYHGKKKLLNLGIGWIQQKDAMWHLTSQGDTIHENMTLLGADLFFETPISPKKNTITVYLAFTDYQLGKNYLRLNQGVMNPGTGVTGNSSIAGGGNAVPIIGIGATLFSQFAYKFKDHLLPNHGSLQLFTNAQISQFQAVKEPMKLYEVGINWLINGDHRGKITVSYQSRPIFSYNSLGEVIAHSRKGMTVLQYQIAL
jgi:hypothetical protein